MNAQQLEINKKGQAFAKRQSTEILIECFEMLLGKPATELSHVRGWIMDELEARNQEAFNAWLDSTEASPRKLYL